MTMADVYLKLLQDAITQLDGPEDDRQERLRRGFPLTSSGSTRGKGAMALERGARGENRVHTSGNVIRVDFRKPERI